MKEEVEKQIYNPLRNVRQMEKKLGASLDKMHTSWLLFDEIWVERSTTLGGNNKTLCCRDEDLNARVTF